MNYLFTYFYSGKQKTTTELAQLVIPMGDLVLWVALLD